MTAKNRDTAMVKPDLSACETEEQWLVILWTDGWRHLPKVVEEGLLFAKRIKLDGDGRAALTWKGRRNAKRIIKYRRST